MYMHILFIQPKLTGAGGIEKAVPTLAKSLYEDGETVSSLVLYNEIPDQQNFWHNRITLEQKIKNSFFGKIKKIIERVYKLQKEIQKVNSDVLIVSAQWTSILVLFLKAIHRVDAKVIVYVHQSLHAYDFFFTPYVMHFFYRYADGFLCVSKGIEKEVHYLCKKVNKKAKIEIAYNPIERNIVQLNDEEKVFVEELKKPLFISISRIEKIRGVDILIALFEKWSKKNGGSLLIIGDGGEYSVLQKEIQRKNIKSIYMLGYKENAKAYIQYATAYIATPRSEALGVSFVESLQAGVPLITSDVAYGPREVMNVTSDDMHTRITPYGILLDRLDVLEKSSDAADRLYASFEQAMKEVKEISWDKKVLQERAYFFSTEKQKEQCVQLLKKVLH